jgi:integrase
MNMGYRIHRVGVLPEKPPSWLEQRLRDTEWDEIRENVAPSGFHLVVTDNAVIVEPVFLWLWQKFRRNKRSRVVGNTQKAYCEDLYEWLSYLEIVKRRWDLVSAADLELYVDRMVAATSPKTGRPYAPATIRRRMATILSFYKWAAAKGMLAHDIGDVAVTETIRLARAQDTDAMAHLHSDPAEAEVSTLLPPAYEKDQVDAFSPRDLKAVLHHLGPSHDAIDDPRPHRDRIIATLAVSTGMRIDEIASLTLPQFATLRRDPAYDNYPLQLTKTKRLRPRTVIVPGSVYDDVAAYVDTERRAAVSHRRQTDALFVNHAHAPRAAGGRLTATSVSRSFHAAVVQAGLYRSFKDPEGRDRVVANHTFHDLRHTFALVMYFELKRRGNPSPWMPLKNLLGHKHLSTTMNTYLRSVETLEATMTDMIDAYLRKLRDA